METKKNAGKSKIKPIKETPYLVQKFYEMAYKLFQTLDKEEFPHLYKSLNVFLLEDEARHDYISFADSIVEADKPKNIPQEAMELALAIYEAEIKLGNPQAMNNVASLFYSGRLTGEPDYVNARKYYEMADRAGLSLASENLGYFYYYGLSVDKDYGRAYAYFSKAAMRDLYEATFKIGDMYRYGQFVEKDDRMAAECYFKAEKLISGTQPAYLRCFGSVYHRIADLYYEGIGVDQDMLKAMHYYQMAECGYYRQIKAGDIYSFGKVDMVIDRQNKLRKKLKKEAGISSAKH